MGNKFRKQILPAKMWDKNTHQITSFVCPVGCLANRGDDLHTVHCKVLCHSTRTQHHLHLCNLQIPEMCKHTKNSTIRDKETTGGLFLKITFPLSLLSYSNLYGSD